MLKYCTRCFYPNTKPDLMFDEQGVCSACTAFEYRKTIDWKQREEDFKKLVYQTKLMKFQYDCVVPVSGGKDSTYQVLKALEYGLNPLAVTASTDHLSLIGRRNLDNIGKLGVDHFEITVNRKLRAKVSAHALREVGDISWVEHVTIFTLPIRIAVQLGIPLIIWGENPQSEYGGPYEAQKAVRLDKRWLQEYGGLNGLRVGDLIDQKVGTEKELHLYTYPNLDLKTTNGIFLGQFFAWDGLENAIIAGQNGFKYWYGPVEGVGYAYENLDNHQTGVHDYFKYLKFGFGRATDLVNNHIRRDRIKREEGKAILLQYDGKYPATYLGVSLEEILDPLEITIPEFLEICNKFANKDLFECKKGQIPRPLFKNELRNA